MKWLGQRTLAAIAITTAVSVIPFTSSHAESYSYDEFMNNPELIRRLTDNLLDYTNQQFISSYPITKDVGDGDVVLADYTPKRTPITHSPIHKMPLPQTPVKDNKKIIDILKREKEEHYTSNGPISKGANTLKHFGDYLKIEVGEDITGLNNRLLEALPYINDIRNEERWHSEEFEPEFLPGKSEFNRYFGRITVNAAIEQFER